MKFLLILNFLEIDLDLLQKFRKSTLEILKNETSNPIQDLNRALRNLAAVRSALIYNTIVNSEGAKVFQGPFKGMKFFSDPSDISEGCFVPKLIGSYESELHPLIEDLKVNKPDVIINIGAAEGYYSVGLKRLLGDADVYAYDIDPKSKEKTIELSKLNKVDITCREEFFSSELNPFRKNSVLIFCDIEGDELKLFEKDEIINYENFSIVVETHMTPSGHSKDILPDLFSKTHEIKVIEQKGSNSFTVPDSISQSNHLDILLSKWEFRDHPTPWLALTPKNKAI